MGAVSRLRQYIHSKWLKAAATAIVLAAVVVGGALLVKDGIVRPVAAPTSSTAKPIENGMPQAASPALLEGQPSEPAQQLQKIEPDRAQNPPIPSVPPAPQVQTAPEAPRPEAPAVVERAPAPAVVPDNTVFQFTDVEKKARELAESSFRNSDSQVPGYLLSLTNDQWNRIRFKPNHTLWKYEGLPFSVQFFHPGFIYNRVVALNVVEAGHSEKLPFASSMFDYGDEGLAGKVRQSAVDFAGFRLLFPLNRPDQADEIAVFLGATYFRAVGKNAAFGLSARGLSLNTALPSGEEFPYFREFWLVKPRPDDASITIYALMDSPSMTGAFRFVVTPGTSTVMDVGSTLFLRSGARWPEKIGLAPLSSMFMFSETTNGSRWDYRPEVHNSDGLLYQDANNTWVWSPLLNSERLAVNAFPLENPRGFGLLQRDTNFDHYQDIGARFERRSSLWVEPQKDWGPGRLELIEIPSKEEIHDNILAFWVPDAPGPQQLGGENGPASGQSRAFAYKLYWMTPGVTPHTLGRAVSTRLVRAQDAGSALFVLDFEGEELNSLPADTGLTSVIDTPPECLLQERQLLKNPVTGGWRLQFKVRLPQKDGMMQNILSATEAQPRWRFRALLKKGENLPDPLTEVWVFDMPL